MATRSKLADFETISRLGAGSFGTVYKVRRFIDGNLYVIKNVRIVELSFKEQSEAINEVQILAQLKSPYVVRYYDSFIEDNSLHIVMEFCNRGDLQNLIKKAKDKNVQCLKENVIWNVTLQIMLGLHYLHKKHILHRDLKSANVFLMKDETKAHYLVKIGDLGVAKLMDTSTALANTIVGTPYYLSPELCADMPYRDKSDCWALGVLVFECATLEHPFEARNQCALIMKIIEAQVKVPPNTPISTELRNVILWLLQKDPNMRPSIKDVLNEQVVRDKLTEHQFELPEELRDAKVTDLLSSPNFEKRANLKKNTSGIHQLMNQRHQEEARAAAAAAAGAVTSTTTNGTEAGKEKVAKETREVPRKPVLQQPPAGKSRESSSRDVLRIGGGDSTPISPSANRGVRRTGSTVAATNAELKADLAPGLAVAGNGMGSRNNSNSMLIPNYNTHNGALRTTTSTVTPALRGTSGEITAIRGDRVRGPSFQRRVPSDKAMNRYQVRPQPPVYNHSRHGSESKMNTDGDDGEDGGAVAQYKDTEEEDAGMGGEVRRTPERAASTRSMRQSPVPTATDAADSKESFEYEPDFEDEDEDGQGGEGNAAAQVHAESRSNSNYMDSSNLSASRKLSAQDMHDEAQDKGGDGLVRGASMKIDLADDKGGSNNVDFLHSSLSNSIHPHQRSMRFHDPFHATDQSTLPDLDPYQHTGTGTLSGDHDPWDPVWTQGRGVIATSISGSSKVQSELGTEDLFARPEGILEDAEEGDEGAEEEEEDQQGDDSDISSLLDIIEDLKSGAIAIAGESLFWKVYDLCAKYIDRPQDGDTTALLLQDLEAMLLHDGSSLELACEVAFKVTKLQAFEFSYRAHMDQRGRGRG